MSMYILPLLLTVLLFSQAHAKCTFCKKCDFTDLANMKSCGYSIDKDNMAAPWGSYEFSKGYFKAFVKKTSSGGVRGRAEINISPMLTRPFDKDVVKVTYKFFSPKTTKWGAPNQGGCVAQFQEMAGNNRWVPAYLLMVRPYDDLDFAVFRGTNGKADIIEGKIADGILGRLNVVEITSKFTTGNDGFHSIVVNGKNIGTWYKGRTVPTGKYDLHWKVGTYSMGDQPNESEIWIDSTEITLNPTSSKAVGDSAESLDTNTTPSVALSTGAIAGIIVGALLVVIAVVVLVVFLVKRNTATKQEGTNYNRM